MSAAAVDPALGHRAVRPATSADVLASGYIVMSTTAASLLRQPRSATSRAAPVERWRTEPARGSAPSWRTTRLPAELLLPVDPCRRHRLRAAHQRPDLRLPVRPGHQRRAGGPRAACARTCASGGPPRAAAAARRTPPSTWRTPRPSSGEFWYMSRGNGLVTIDPAWQQANIVRNAYSGVPIVASCHRLIVPAIQAALTEVAAAGLAGAIDVANTNRYGGCFGPREVRPPAAPPAATSPGTRGAMALDMNTATNPLGGVPTMDCRRRVDLPQVRLRLGRQLHSRPTACTSSGSARTADQISTRRRTARTRARPAPGREPAVESLPSPAPIAAASPVRRRGGVATPSAAGRPAALASCRDRTVRDHRWRPGRQHRGHPRRPARAPRSRSSSATSSAALRTCGTASRPRR